MPQAFAALYEAHSRVVEHYIRLRVDDVDLAQDLTAETFTIAWEKYSTGTAITRGWLLKTARNLIGNEYQRRARVRERTQRLVAAQLVVAQHEIDDIADVELKAAIARLRPADALVLKLTYWCGLPAAEAAQFLGCTTVSYWQRLARARAALRAELGAPGTAVL
ncbi:RNA polymerase sigma factor [Microbacterium sp. NPDC006705]|uniref:RNA polymerase sigma factor n=1 Tax=Microbacterium sp. NPDC006705 TaxID=3364181 RepID=UPI00384D2039